MSFWSFSSHLQVQIIHLQLDHILKPDHIDSYTKYNMLEKVFAALSSPPLQPEQRRVKLLFTKVAFAVFMWRNESHVMC